MASIRRLLWYNNIRNGRDQELQSLSGDIGRHFANLPKQWKNSCQTRRNGLGNLKLGGLAPPHVVVFHCGSWIGIRLGSCGVETGWLGEIRSVEFVLGYHNGNDGAGDGGSGVMFVVAIVGGDEYQGNSDRTDNDDKDGNNTCKSIMMVPIVGGDNGGKGRGNSGGGCACSGGDGGGGDDYGDGNDNDGDSNGSYGCGGNDGVVAVTMAVTVMVVPVTLFSRRENVCKRIIMSY
ncbi:hypothetical protein DVH24_030032 [Malus domestica]|uniref:Uncharacterized protein n=1 Tax=Malus domestica TaxID=3750 RepID=A0A498I1K8_MALDO|nr:hypothetical protein DVH24_030032 [Malus domestica]